MISADMQDVLGFCFDFGFPGDLRACPEISQSSIKESDQQRTQNAAEVEDLRKQLSEAAAEPCLHWHDLAMSHCVGLIAWQGGQL